MINLFLFFLISFLLTSGDLFSQKIRYTMQVNGREMGELQVERRFENEIEIITSRTNVKVDFLIKRMEVFSLIHTEYEGGLLQKAETRKVVNGEDKEFSKIYRVRTGYHFKNHEDELKNLPHSSINFTVNRLFFQEPVNLNQVFSERFGKYLKIEKAGPGYYLLHVPDEDPNGYYYKNGQFVKLDVNHSLMDISFVLVN